MKIDLDSDPRLRQVNEWLTAILPDRDFELKVASSDASFRRYFRVYQHGQSRIVMDAPLNMKISRLLCASPTSWLAQAHVPHIYARNVELGFLLLSDLGTSYLSALNQDSADRLYQAAIDEIIKMQLAPVSEIELPAYDDEKLLSEMRLFPDWFLERHLSLAVPSELDSIFELLIDNANINRNFLFIATTSVEI